MKALPKRWTTVTLGEAGLWVGGGTPSKARPEYWVDGTVPWLSPKDMGSNVLLGTQDRITDAAVAGSSAKRVPAGSVAVVVRSGILERTLPVALVPFETTLNQDMKAVIPHANIDARWVAWGLRALESKVLRDCRKAGTTVASIDTQRLLRQVLPVPPIEEQRQIIETLEGHLLRLGSAKTSLNLAEKRVIGLRDRMLMQAWDEAVATVGSRRLRKIGEIIGPGRRLAYGVLVPGPDVPNGVPLVRVGDLRSDDLSPVGLKRVAPHVADRFPRTRLSGGEVLLSLVGTIGRTNVVPDDLAGANVARAIGVLPVSDDINPRFLSRLFQSPLTQRALEALAHEVARKTLNLEDVRRFEVPVPERAAQDRIVDQLEASLGELRRLEQPIGSIDRRVTSLRQALMGAAFTGELSARRDNS